MINAKRFIFLLLSLLFMTVSVASQQLLNDSDVRKGTLDNGLTYYIVHNERPEKRAEFYLATNVGALQERPDQDGLAHFLEHMCFNGTKNFPGKSMLDYLQSIGASFGGNVNASTGVEETVYMLRDIPLLRETVIDTCLMILHDFSHYVTFDSVEIENERGVIIEERRSRDNATWRMNEQTKPFLYGNTKYAKCSLIGSLENLESFQPSSLMDFYDEWYRPDLQAVIVVGDVNVDSVESKITALWSDIPKHVNQHPKNEITIPDNYEPIIGIVTDPEFPALNIAFYWKKPIESEEGNCSAMKLVDDLIEDIVANAMMERFSDLKTFPSSPVNDVVFTSQNVCETLDAVQMIVASKEGEWKLTFEIAVTEAERLRRFGLLDGEIERAKANILSSYESAAANSATRKNSELVQPLINNFFDNYDYMSPVDKYQFVKSVLPQIQNSKINEKAGQMITDDNMVILYYAPQKDGLAHPDEEQLKEILAKVKASDIERMIDKTIADEFVDSATLPGCSVTNVESAINGATELTLENGATVVLMPTEYEKDKIGIRLYKKGGMSLVATEDLPSFESNIWQIFQMNQGIFEYPSSDVKKMLAGREVSATAYISSFYHGITASTVPKDIETTFQLIYLIFCKPRFDENEFNQSISMIRSALGTLENMPQWQLQKAAIKTLYNGSPRHLILSESVLEKASLETMSRVYRSLFNDAAGLVVAIVGDFNTEAVIPFVEKYIGSIPKGDKALDWGIKDDVIVKGNITNDFNVKMETPKVTVSQVYSLTAPFTLTRDAAYDALRYILDMIYTNTLREDEGGTYGVQVNVVLGKEPTNQDILEVDFETNPETADKLRELARNELKNLATYGPTADYFDKAIKNLKKKMPEDKLKNSYWLTVIENWYRYRIDYACGYESALETLRPEDVRNAAREMLESGNFIEIILRPEIKDDNQ